MIILPLVAEKIFDFLPQLKVDELAIVELAKGAHESSQVVGVFQGGLEGFELVEDIDEVAH